MLAKVKRPDSAEVSFKYDALGRRISKRFRNIITRWTWDGNVPLHEQKTQYWRDYEKERGEFLREDKQPLVTWVFEEGTFVPVARITEKQQLSIVTNYLGTPEAMYREDGEAVWTCELNSYGKVRNFQGEFKTDCPFRYQGQYEDSETGLFYTRFRYYDAEVGVYLSQDPIRTNGGLELYSYVHEPNSWIDEFGLTAELYKLVAKKDGYYDLKQYGQPDVSNGAYLRKGDVYKFGETAQFNKNGVQKRYSQAWLRKNNLEYVRLQNSPNKSAKKAFQKLETAKIDKHKKRRGKIPAGNSCRH
jgi:RHS repeat-associated protein